MGRLLAQTAVTLDANTVKIPTSAASVLLVSSSDVQGPYAAAAGQSADLATSTITVPMSGNVEFYQITSATALRILSIGISGGNVVITYN